MKKQVITEENIEELDELLPEDIAENIGRSSYQAIAMEEGTETSAAMVWEYRYLEDENRDPQSHLSWIFAKDNKAGENLFTEYAKDISEEGIVKSVAAFAASEAGEMVEILKAAGFSITEKEVSNIHVTIGDLEKLDVLKKKKTAANLRPLEDLQVRIFRRGIMNCIFHTKREHLEDLATLPIDWYDTDVSCCVTSDDRIDGFFLVHRLSSGRLRVEFMAAVGPDARIDLINMIRFSAFRAIEKYPKETEIILPRRDESAEKLVGYFFPGAKGEPGIYGEREEK